MAIPSKPAPKNLQEAAAKRQSSKASGHYVGFDKLAKKVGSPALAAYIGRKKYGNQGFAALSKGGK